jgi:sulfate transport system ATP-binding protein
VFVTHDQEEALELADRVVVMNRGRIEQEGTPDELFHRPATPFVAEFLGQVNLLRGRVDESRAVRIEPKPTDASGRLYIRPHEIELLSVPSDDAIAVTIRRVRLAGPTVKVEAIGPHEQPLDIELSHASWRGLALSPGDSAFARPSEVRVFPADYTI